MSTEHYDVILAGGGLANGLIAWRLKALQPQLRILLVEQKATLQSDNVWSFHEGDLTEQQRAWIQPLVEYQWDSYRVHFPDFDRQFFDGYATVTGQRLGQVLEAALRAELRLGVRITQLTPREIMLDTGEVMHASVVIDGRGAVDSPQMVVGQQVFLRQRLRTQRPHGLGAPIVMDACIGQGQAYRYAHVLPLSDDTLLVEDTYFVDGTAPSREQLRRSITHYVESHGWSIAQVISEELGTLPITLAGDFDAFWTETAGQPRSGARAGFYHATTGYALPHAIRLAQWVSEQPVLEAAALFQGIHRLAQRDWRQQGFNRVLNRLLLLAGKPEYRWRVMQRFYSGPRAMIQRFHAGRMTTLDKLQVVAKRIPVPLAGAVQAVYRHQPRQFQAMPRAAEDLR